MSEQDPIRRLAEKIAKRMFAGFWNTPTGYLMVEGGSLPSPLVKQAADCIESILRREGVRVDGPGERDGWKKGMTCRTGAGQIVEITGFIDGEDIARVRSPEGVAGTCPLSFLNALPDPIPLLGDGTRPRIGQMAYSVDAGEPLEDELRPQEIVAISRDKVALVEIGFWVDIECVFSTADGARGWWRRSQEILPDAAEKGEEPHDH